MEFELLKKEIRKTEFRLDCLSEQKADISLIIEANGYINGLHKALMLLENR